MASNGAGSSVQNDGAGNDRASAVLQPENEPFPRPDQVVASGKRFPLARGAEHYGLDTRMRPVGDELANNRAMTRRQFFKTTNVVAAFIVVNEICRLLFDPRALARAQEKAPGTPLDQQALIRALQNGGYVIYFRHAATDQSQVDTNRVDFKNCGTQRNLSQKGREQAQAIGKAFAGLGIKVSNVFSSPYCRCIDTAKLAFGNATILPDLEFAISKSEPEAKRLGAVLRKLLETKPPRGTNTVLIAHSANLKEAVDIWAQPEGAAYIFQPQDDGRLVHVARLAPEEWVELVRLK